MGRVFVYGKIYKGQMRGDTRLITWPLLVPFNAGTDFDARKRPPPDARSYSPFLSHQKIGLW